MNMTQQVPGSKSEIPPAVTPEVYDPESPSQQAKIARASMLLGRLQALADFEEMLGAHDWAAINAQAIEASHPTDAHDYYMFHLINGSGPKTTPKYFDFPGDESILRALEALAGKDMYGVAPETQ